MESNRMFASRRRKIEKSIRPLFLSHLFLVTALIACNLIVAAAWANDDITECDRLISHPLDPDRVTTGVPTAKMDHAAGIAACLAAIEADPDSARAHYQLARVYFYDDQVDKAMPHLEIASAGNYRQAMFVLGYILDSGVDGVATDVCRTEDLWLRSARADRLAALVSYPHHVVRGRFDACQIQASKAEMVEFLERARARDLDYYQGVLVGDVTADLEQWAPE